MSKILLVEDDVVHREMVSRYLGRAGYQVIAAGDGNQAVALSRSESPDLILMDMGLPVLNGWLATQQIKASPDTQSIPIVALTAYAMVEERDRSLQAGCDDYEAKPVDFSQLLLKIQRLLLRQREY